MPARILLAEDDDAMRLLLAASLKRLGFDVEEAGDGAELLATLSDDLAMGRRPQLVVADVQMPGLTGLDVLHTVRGSLDVPVILITAFGDRRLHQRARELGAYRVFDKPFPLEELCQCVQEVLDTNTAR